MLRTLFRGEIETVTCGYCILLRSGWSSGTSTSRNSSPSGSSIQHSISPHGIRSVGLWIGTSAALMRLSSAAAFDTWIQRLTPRFGCRGSGAQLQVSAAKEVDDAGHDASSSELPIDVQSESLLVEPATSVEVQHGDLESAAENFHPATMTPKTADVQGAWSSPRNSSASGYKGRSETAPRVAAQESFLTSTGMDADLSPGTPTRRTYC